MTRDWTHTPGTGSSESWPLKHQGSLCLASYLCPWWKIPEVFPPWLVTTNHFKLQDSTRPSFLPAHDLFIIHTSTHLVQHDRYRRGSLPGFFRHHDERRPKISKKSCRCCFPDCGIIGSMVISTRTPVVRTTTSVSVCRRGAGRGETAVRRAAGDPHSEALKREHRHGRILPSGCWGHSTGAHSAASRWGPARPGRVWGAALRHHTRPGQGVNAAEETPSPDTADAL